MNAHVEETSFISFVCPSCRQEIEAPVELANQETECPACAALIHVPAVHERPSHAQLEAMKSRTIRIELPGNW